MSLSINDLEIIARNIAKSKDVKSYEFEIIANEVKGILELNKVKFVNGKKLIHSLPQLSTNFCQYINKEVNNPIIDKISFEFRKKVALILETGKIGELGMLLSRIKDLDSWNPTLLMSIGRKSVRENDVLNKYQEVYNKAEKRKILSIYQWIKTNIRNKDTNTIDWNSIMEKLREEGYEDLANKFTTQA